MTSISVITVIAIASFTGFQTAFAEDEYPYNVADDIRTIFTFTFKDGVEVVELPVFTMNDNYIHKNTSPGFSVEGAIGDSPLLHKALDEAFKYKANPSYEYDYQLFEVDIDFSKNEEVVKSLSYHDCKVTNYKVTTLQDDYESYMSSSTGFAIIDDIDFICGGLNSRTDIVNDQWRPTFTSVDYDQTPYKFAEDVRTFIKFEFDQGIEVIEFPYFQTNSGFEESDDNVIPGFSVEGTIQKHTLLDQAIDKARQNGGIPNGVNVDFEATVEFKKGSEILRTFEYKDCRVSGALLTTQTDKEEGFTGKGGFAYVEQIDFECIGLDTVNDSYDKLYDGYPVWSTSLIENTLASHEYPLGTGPRAIVKFTYDNGVEKVDFPIFIQHNVLKKSGANFELGGVIRNSPMLYKQIDNNLALTSTTGFTNFLPEFNVDVELVQEDKVVRGFNYIDCRVIDYTITTQRDKEESYFKGFAIQNNIEFECKGYHPNVPTYDALFNSFEKAKTTNSGDLRNTQTWGPGFYYGK